MTDATEDDDFVDIIPAKFAAQKLPALMVRVVKMRSAVRVQFSFEEGVLDEIHGPRFDIAWSMNRRQFRITAKDLGRYEPAKVGRGNRSFLRCPLPPGFHPGEEIVDPEFYVNRETRVITVEMDDHFKPRALPSPVRPMAGPSHKDIVQRAKEAVPSKIDSLSSSDLDQKTIRTALGLNEPRALVLGDHRFTKTEAVIVELLAARERVTKQAIMIGTADPAGDDNRDEKLADVLIHKIRPKLDAPGFKVMTQFGESWTIAASQRRELRAIIAAARKEG